MMWLTGGCDRSSSCGAGFPENAQKPNVSSCVIDRQMYLSYYCEHQAEPPFWEDSWKLSCHEESNATAADITAVRINDVFVPGWMVSWSLSTKHQKEEELEKRWSSSWGYRQHIRWVILHACSDKMLHLLQKFVSRHKTQQQNISQHRCSMGQKLEWVWIFSSTFITNKS